MAFPEIIAITYKDVLRGSITNVVLSFEGKLPAYTSIRKSMSKISSQLYKKVLLKMWKYCPDSL